MKRIISIIGMTMLIGIAVFIAGCSQLSSGQTASSGGNENGGGENGKHFEYAGFYKGTITGVSSGSWKMTVDNDRKLLGEFIVESLPIAIQGTVGDDGQFTVKLRGPQFSGTINKADGTGSGNWKKDDKEGTFAGKNPLVGVWEVTSIKEKDKDEEHFPKGDPHLPGYQQRPYYYFPVDETKTYIAVKLSGVPADAPPNMKNGLFKVAVFSYKMMTETELKTPDGFEKVAFAITNNDTELTLTISEGSTPEIIKLKKVTASSPTGDEIKNADSQR